MGGFPLHSCEGAKEGILGFLLRLTMNRLPDTGPCGPWAG